MQLELQRRFRDEIPIGDATDVMLLQQLLRPLVGGVDAHVYRLRLRIESREEPRSTKAPERT